MVKTKLALMMPPPKVNEKMNHNMFKTKILVACLMLMSIHTCFGQSLFEAAMKGDIDSVTTMIYWEETPINEQDDKGRTALLGAAFGGHLDIVEFLLDYEVYVNIQDDEGRTALHPAAMRGHIEIVEALLYNGIDPRTRDDDGKTAHDYAVYKGHSDIAELIRNTDPPSQGDLLVEAAFYNDYAKVRNLLSNGVNIHTRSEEGATVILAAAIGGDYDMMNLIIQNGGDVNGEFRGITPLHLAAFVGNLEVVDLLIKSYANVNVKDEEDGITPLHQAAANGFYYVVRLLVDNGASVNTKSIYGITPLHVAAEAYGDTERIIQFLIDEGSDLEGKDDVGWTALHFAASASNMGSVQTLIRNGANATAEDSEGSTARDLAIENGDTEISNYLRSYE